MQTTLVEIVFLLLRRFVQISRWFSHLIGLVGYGVRSVAQNGRLRRQAKVSGFRV